PALPARSSIDARSHRRGVARGEALVRRLVGRAPASRRIAHCVRPGRARGAEILGGILLVFAQGGGARLPVAEAAISADRGIAERGGTDRGENGGGAIEA